MNLQVLYAFIRPWNVSTKGPVKLLLQEVGADGSQEERTERHTSEDSLVGKFSVFLSLQPRVIFISLRQCGLSGRTAHRRAAVKRIFRSTVPARAQDVLHQSTHLLLETRWGGGQELSPRNRPFLMIHCVLRSSLNSLTLKNSKYHGQCRESDLKDGGRADPLPALVLLLNNNNNYYNYNNNKESCSLSSREGEDLFQGDPGLLASCPPPDTSGDPRPSGGRWHRSA